MPGQFQGDIDIFVMELDPATGTPNWVTLLGGTEDDYSESMQLDSEGNIVIVGYSGSDDYPTLNAFQPNYVGPESPNATSFNWDGTLTKLSANGSTVIFSTYIGGADAVNSISSILGFEMFRGIAIDSNDDIYIAGQTSAADFPVTTTIGSRTCMQSDPNAAAFFTSDIAFAKFSATGDRLMSACIGGTERDGGRGITLGPDGTVYLSGFGRSPDLQGTSGFFQPLPAAELAYSPFVVKMNADLTAIEFATYVGDGLLQNVEVDSSGDIYGVGTSLAGLVPTTPGAFQTEFAGDPVTGEPSDVYAFKLNASGTSLSYATYLGGTKEDDASAFKVDNEGRLYIAGSSNSPDFPLKNPIIDNVGPLLLESSLLTPLTSVNHIRRSRFGPSSPAEFNTYIARNGVNMIGNDTGSTEIGSLSNLGTSDHNSSDMLLDDISGNGIGLDLIVTNRDAANEFYRWDFISESFVFLGAAGSTTTDSRGAASLFPGQGDSVNVAVANYGESNQFVGIGSGSALDYVSIDFGLANGNTTAIKTGIVGPSFVGTNIVVANENQDVRLYPYLGGGTVGDPIILNNAPGAVSAIDIGDVNGDGEQDVVTASMDGPVELILFSAGLPSQTISVPDTAAGNNRDVLLVDVDFDGDLDLYVARTTSDLVFENSGTGAFTLDADSAFANLATTSIATVDETTATNAIYLSTEEGIEVTRAGRSTITLSVLNSTGSDLEFSSFLADGGSSTIFRGLDFAAGSDSKVLIAAGTEGDNWAKVNSTAGQAGNFDAVYMVLELDQDGDSVLDGLDNCLLVANAAQRDTNGDGFGNICDPDLNNDGVVNFVDVSLFSGLFLSDDEDADLNGDGNVAFLDFAILSNYFLLPPGPGIQ